MLPNATETAATTLDVEIVRRIQHILAEAERNTLPLELEPQRGQLFELFVTAEGAGYLEPDAPIDLTADGLCRLLAERYGLRDAAAAMVERHSKLPQQHVAKMRLLWSFMRMWMEWTYAWQRWPEFHSSDE